MALSLQWHAVGQQWEHRAHPMPGALQGRALPRLPTRPCARNPFLWLTLVFQQAHAGTWCVRPNQPPCSLPSSKKISVLRAIPELLDPHPGGQNQSELNAWVPKCKQPSWWYSLEKHILIVGFPWLKERLSQPCRHPCGTAAATTNLKTPSHNWRHLRTFYSMSQKLKILIHKEVYTSLLKEDMKALVKHRNQSITN